MGYGKCIYFFVYTFLMTFNFKGDWGMWSFSLVVECMNKILLDGRVVYGRVFVWNSNKERKDFGREILIVDKILI